MDKYRKVERKNDGDDASPRDKSQVRITQQANIKRLISHATKLLKDEEAGRVELRGMGKMIGKAITVCELLRRKVPELHQQTKLSTISIRDEYEPLEEGLDTVVTERTVSCISIFLSTDEGKIDKDVGYRAPMGAEEFEEFKKDEVENGRTQEGDGERSRTKGGSPSEGGNGVIEGEKEGGEGEGEGKRGGRGGRGRGRGRGRYRGRGRRGRRGRGKNGEGSGKMANGGSEKTDASEASAPVAEGVNGGQ